MRNYIIIAFLLFLTVNTAKARSMNHLQQIFNILRDGHLSGHISYGNDDDNNNYNNDDDNNNNYNNDDDHYSNNDDDNSNYNNDDDNYNNYNDDDNYNGGDDDDSSEIPLDGGLSFLAVAGAGLGIKKLRDNRAKKKVEHDKQ